MIKTIHFCQKNLTFKFVLMKRLSRNQTLMICQNDKLAKMKFLKNEKIKIYFLFGWCNRLHIVSVTHIIFLIMYILHKIINNIYFM
jgi:hypothetical protein